MKLTELLDQILRLDQEATPGPWTTDSTPDEFGIIWGAVEQIGGGFGERAMVTEVVEEHADAEFIALARTALPKLAEAVYQVLELLKAAEKRPSNRFAVMYDGTPWPATVPTSEVRQAIHDAMEGDDE